MRILQINNYEEIGGGSERVYQSTSRLLIEKGHQVATLACGLKSFDNRKKTMLLEKNHYTSKNPLATLKNVKNFIYRNETFEKILKINEEFKPDLAHAHIFYGQLSSSVLAALRFLNIPCVMTVHEYRMLCPVSTLYSNEGQICEKCANGSVLNAVIGRCNRASTIASTISAVEAWYRNRNYPYKDYIDHFFMVSNFCRDKHLQFIPELTSKSSLLYNFVGDEEVVCSPSTSHQGAPFLYAGRLSREKGLPLICDAFARRPDLRLWIAGDGPLAPKLKATYASTANIEFLGKLNPEQLKSRMRQARFMLIPSEWYENNPMSVLESFAQGLPVIGADIGGIPELVIPGHTGQLFAPSDLSALLAALDWANSTSEKDRQVMARNALASIARNHTAAIHYDRLLAGYNQVLAKRRSSGQA